MPTQITTPAKKKRGHRDARASPGRSTGGAKGKQSDLSSSGEVTGTTLTQTKKGKKKSSNETTASGRKRKSADLSEVEVVDGPGDTNIVGGGENGQEEKNRMTILLLIRAPSSYGSLRFDLIRFTMPRLAFASTYHSSFLVEPGR